MGPRLLLILLITLGHSAPPFPTIGSFDFTAKNPNGNPTTTRNKHFLTHLPTKSYKIYIESAFITTGISHF